MGRLRTDIAVHWVGRLRTDIAVHWVGRLRIDIAVHWVGRLAVGLFPVSVPRPMVATRPRFGGLNYRH